MSPLVRSKPYLTDRTVIYLLVLFVCLRLPVFLISVEPWSDGAWYVAKAMDIASGRGYTEAGVPTAYWPVGYPAFLAGMFAMFGSHLIVIKIANLLLGCITAWLIYSVASMVFSNNYVGKLAMLLYTIYPNQIGYTALPLTEILFTFTLLSAVWIFARSQSIWAALLCGAIMGAATLIKTQIVIFPALLLLGFAWHHRQLITFKRFIAISGALYVACVLVIAPWTLRNYSVFGTFVLVSTNGGMALYNGNNPLANGDVVPNDLIPEELRPRPATQMAQDLQARDAALRWITANPGRVLSLLPKKIWRLWAPDGESEWGFQAGYAGYDEHYLLFRGIRAINQAFYFVIGMLFLGAQVILFTGRAVRTPWTWIIPTLVLYTTVISMIFSGQSRYHFPVMPWIMMAAAWFILHLRSSLERQTKILAATTGPRPARNRRT